MSESLSSWILGGITLLVGYGLRHVLGPAGGRAARSLPASDMALLGELAAIVVPFVERKYGHLPGVEKMSRAVATVLAWLDRRGVHITKEEIEAAVERAWADFESSGRSRAYGKGLRKDSGTPRAPTRRPAS